MYARLFLCMHTTYMFTFVYMHVHVWVHMCIYMYACACALTSYVHAHICTCMSLRHDIRVREHTNMQTNMYPRAYKYVCTCHCIYMYAHANVFTCMHMLLYIHAPVMGHTRMQPYHGYMTMSMSLCTTSCCDSDNLAPALHDTYMHVHQHT
jgi:hypothetical protein